VLLRQGSRTIAEATVGADRRFVVRAPNAFRRGMQVTLTVTQMDPAGNLSRSSGPVRFMVVR
jgi:hypothetical protein